MVAGGQNWHMHPEGVATLYNTAKMDTDKDMIILSRPQTPPPNGKRRKGSGTH